MIGPREARDLGIPIVPAKGLQQLGEGVQRVREGYAGGMGGYSYLRKDFEALTGGPWGRVDSISRRVFSESARGIQGVFEGIHISGRVFRVWGT